MFKIEKPVVEKEIKNGYVVEVTASFPNSPGEALVTLGKFTPGLDDAELVDLMETCSRLVKAYPSQREATDGYLHIDGYERWFAPSSLSDSEFRQLPTAVQENAVEWLADPNATVGERATFKSHKLYFYDGTGNKYHVLYEKEMMKGVNSSMIRNIGYLESENKLRVEFKKGGIYVYDGVPKHMYEEMLDSASVGRYFRSNILNRFDFEKE